MTVLDWVLVAIWAGIALGGFWKGAVRIVFGLGGLALGIWLAVAAGDEIAVSLGGVVGNDWLALGLAYVLPVIVVSGLCLLAGWGMEKSLEAAKLGCLNRLLGAVLAGAAAAVVLTLLLLTAVGLSPEVARVGERSLLLAKVRTLTDRTGPGQGAEAPAASDGSDSDADDGSSGR